MLSAADGGGAGVGKAKELLPPRACSRGSGPGQDCRRQGEEQIKLAVCRITRSDPLLVTHFVQRTYLLLSCPLKAFYRAQIHIRIPPLE
jgi:hypothetical protein